MSDLPVSQELFLGTFPGCVEEKFLMKKRSAALHYRTPESIMPIRHQQIDLAYSLYPQILWDSVCFLVIGRSNRFSDHE